MERIDEDQGILQTSWHIATDSTRFRYFLKILFFCSSGFREFFSSPKE